MSMQRRFLPHALRIVQCLSLATLSTAAAAASIMELPTGLANASFGQLAANAAGDVVAVSRTNVFVGSIPGQTLVSVFADPNVTFVVEDEVATQVSDTVYVNNPRCEPGVTANVTIPVTAGVELQATRLALNARGDFVVASRTKIFAGNARNRTFRTVYTGDAGTEFQRVLINDNGDYLAASFRNVFAGNVADQTASQLITAALGDFSEYGLGTSSNRIETWYGETHLALNAAGQFIAASSQTIYGGSVPQRTVETLLGSRQLGVEQVRLSDTGEFVVTTDSRVFVGRL